MDNNVIEIRKKSPHELSYMPSESKIEVIWNAIQCDEEIVDVDPE